MSESGFTVLAQDGKARRGRLATAHGVAEDLIEIVTIKVHTISESTPSALCGVNWPPVACTTVCSV